MDEKPVLCQFQGRISHVFHIQLEEHPRRLQDILFNDVNAHALYDLHCLFVRSGCIGHHKKDLRMSFFGLNLMAYLL